LKTAERENRVMRRTEGEKSTLRITAELNGEEIAETA
jgi:hypothetical protein